MADSSYEEVFMTADRRPLAIVTGASSGIGFELARRCVKAGYDLIVAADDAQIHVAANELRAQGTDVRAVQVDLSTEAGVDELCAASEGRPVAALIANS